MKELYIDEPAKWKMRQLRQIHTADPVGKSRKLCLYTILEYSVLARLSAHTATGSAVHYVFGERSSSSILRTHLYTTYSSMVRDLILIHYTADKGLIFGQIPILWLNVAGIPSDGPLGGGLPCRRGREIHSLQFPAV